MDNFTELIKDCKTIKDAVKIVFDKNYVNAQLGKKIKDLCEQNGYTWEEHLEGLKEEKFCLYCGKKIDLSKRDKRAKFCNNSCAASYNNSQRHVSEETKKKKSKIAKKNSYTYQNKKNKLYKQRSLSFKERLFRDNIKEYKCEKCGINEWQGEKIVLEIHHINGKHQDDRIENIQILCPNCHSQTYNYRNLNRGYFPIAKKFFCTKCGKETYGETKSGLCFNCYIQEEKDRSKCPSKERLLYYKEKNVPKSIIAKEFNVCIRTVTKWYKNNLIEY